MLRPFLLVGVGGSGGKTLRAVRQNLLAKLRQDGWTQGIPDAWQFLHVDSPNVQDGAEFDAPFLPLEDYISLVPNGVNYANIYQSIKNVTDSKYIKDIEKPLPSEDKVDIPIYQGAGAYRAIGRTIAVAALGKIHQRAQAAITKMQTTSADATLTELTKHLGFQVTGKQPPAVIIVSSIAGGSGAGMFIDVTEAVKSAAGPKPWAEHSFALLYAPDVFEQVNNMGAIAPNALAAISETMSGYWNTNPSEATQALYKSSGLNQMQNADTRIGPRYSYVIGRKNGLVDFGSQPGVYKAVASSISTWMTDFFIQDKMSAYAATNFGSKATPLKDESGLKVGGEQTPPFSSLGFARVSLGMEKFVDYAVERLAKQTLETILNKHLEQDPGRKEKTSEQWVTHFADSAEGRFLSDSKLNELTEANNDIIDALTPLMDEPVQRFGNSVKEYVEQSVGPKGLDLSTWVDRITNAYGNTLPSALEGVSALRNEKIRKWVSEMPNHVQWLVTSYISEQGLPVTVELLKRLVEKCSRASDELKEERARHLMDASQVQIFVSTALKPVESQAAIPKGHPTIAEAYRQAQSCFAIRAYADLKENAADLVQEFVEDFLKPLLKELESGQRTLVDRVNDSKLLDQRENPYTSWPDFNEKSVPKKFEPAPNEQLLIEHSNYPDEFDTLVLQTINDPRIDAKRKVVDEIITGEFGIETLKNIDDPDMKWNLIGQQQMWIPKNRIFQVQQSSPSQARFNFATDHMAYLEFAYKWVNLPGRRFQSYLDQTIATYLSDESDKNEQSKRQTNFVKKFQAAVASSNPLVEFDSGLLNLIHEQQATEKSITVSAIPVDRGDTLFEALKDILVTYGYWSDSSADWFKGPGTAGKVRYIDLFTQTSFPVQPMVMSSVMGPISQTWGSASAKKVSRTNFLKWRRARSLSETIPASPTVWRQMLRGWYVARLLNQLKSDNSSANYEEVGPDVSIWVDGGSNYVSFPYPLMNANLTPVSDMPGVILDSLTVALANCYSEHSLRPLAPYQRLLKLGGSENQVDRELAEWIVSGKHVGQGTQDTRGGSASDTFEIRREKSISYLEGELSKFQKSLSDLDEFSDPRSYPVSWEIRNEIAKAIQDVINGIRSAAPEETL
jgi:hypothetical protein